MPPKAVVKPAGKYFPRIDTLCVRCQRSVRKKPVRPAPDIRPARESLRPRAQGARGPSCLRRSLGMTPSRLFPPLRSATVATADVRRAVPGVSAGVLAVIAIVALLLAPAGPARADVGPGGVDVPDSPVGAGGGITTITAADSDFVMRVRL